MQLLFPTFKGAPDKVDTMLATAILILPSYDPTLHDDNQEHVRRCFTKESCRSRAPAVLTAMTEHQCRHRPAAKEEHEKEEGCLTRYIEERYFTVFYLQIFYHDKSFKTFSDLQDLHHHLDDHLKKGHFIHGKCSVTDYWLLLDNILTATWCVSDRRGAVT